MMDEQELQPLLARFRATRDPEALASFFDATAPRLFGLARHLSNNVSDAEDLLQSTYLAVIESIDRYNAERSALGWVMGILSLQARYQHRRGARRTPVAEENAEDGGIQPEAEAAYDEARVALRNAVADLPDLYRDPVELVVSQGMGPSEIATRLGRSAGTVRVQLHRGYEMLRKALPASLALSSAFLATPRRGLAEIRREVLSRAATAPVATAGAGGISMLMITGFAATLALSAVILTQDGVSGSTPPPRAESTATVTRVPAPTSEGEPVPHQATDTEDRRVPSDGPQRSKPSEPQGSVRHGEIVLTEGQGYSFTLDQVVPLGDAELRLLDDDRADPSDLGKVAGYTRFRRGQADGRSPDCYLRSVVSFDPGEVDWETRSYANPRESHTFVLQLAAGGYAVASVVDSQRVDGEDQYVVRYAYHPSAPTFLDAAPTDRRDGLAIDMTAFEADPWQEELDRRYAAMVAIPDQAAARLATLDQGSPTSAVWAVMSRTYAATISDTFSYRAATFSFAHATRDDEAATYNDWELLYYDPPRASPSLHVNTVSYQGLLWSLGAIGLESIEPSMVAGRPGSRQVTPARGETYLIQTFDEDTDRWDAIRVLHIEADHFLVFRWLPIGDELSVALARALASSKPPISGVVDVQIRGGAGGGNAIRAFLDGTTNARVDELVDRPLDLTAPISMREPSRAWIRGGAIPSGKVWRVTRVEYIGRTGGDSNGPGGLRILLGDESIADVPQSGEPIVDAVWTGQVDLRPGDESRCYVEIRNSSQADVRFIGQLVDG